MNYGGDYGGGGGRGGGGYQTTSYSGGGGGGGGGFMTSSQGGSQATPGKAFKDSSIRPVTIKQLLEAAQPHTDAKIFNVDDTELFQVTFVGQVRNIVEQATNITLKIDDGTGMLEVKYWLDMSPVGEEGHTAEKMGIVEGCYVRILGNLRASEAGRRHVNTHNLRIVEDHNEVLFHLLEATAVHLHFTKGPIESIGKGGGGGGGYGDDTHMADAGAVGGGGGGGGGDNLPLNARKVRQAIRSVPDSNEGLHVQQIADKTGLKLPDVYTAVEQLIELGIGFTTIDDDHIAIMD